MLCIVIIKRCHTTHVVTGYITAKSGYKNISFFGVVLFILSISVAHMNKLSYKIFKSTYLPNTAYFDKQERRIVLPESLSYLINLSLWILS